MRELLKELLVNYRALYTEYYREVEVAEQKSIRKMAETASSTFQTLFGNSQELTQEFLADESPDAEPRILDRLNSMAEDVQRQRPGGLSRTTWSAVADTVDELSDKLEPFIRDSADDDGDDNSVPIWPFIRIIRFAYHSLCLVIHLTLSRIYLRSYILRNGLILADLPGKEEGFNQSISLDALVTWIRSSRHELRSSSRDREVYARLS